MKKSNIREIISLIAIVLIISAMGIFAPGCGSSDNSPTATPTPVPSETVTPTPSPSPTSEGTTYTGQVVNLNNLPMEGVTIELKSATTGQVLDTKQSNSNGNYTFTGLQNNISYIVRFSYGTSYVPMNFVVYLEGNEEDTGQVFGTYSEWQNIAGGKAIENGYGYIAVGVGDTNGDPSQGVAINMTPTSYENKGYLENAKSQPTNITINWNSTLTLDLGSAFFYKVDLNNLYTITPSATGFTFNPPSISGFSPINGEILVMPDFTMVQQ